MNNALFLFLVHFPGLTCRKRLIKPFLLLKCCTLKPSIYDASETKPSFEELIDFFLLSFRDVDISLRCVM